MAVEITSNSVVKILIRRGLESERQLTTLTEGELGYSIDTQRLFVGDGITPGGNIAGNKFLGFTNSINSYTSISQSGDTIFDTSNYTLLGYVPSGPLQGWQDIHPQPFQGQTTNSRYSLEKAPIYSPGPGKWRVSKELIGTNDDIPTGLSLVYDGDPDALNTIQGIKNRVDFDSRFLSLCATSNFPFESCSFYFGNINYKTVTNNLNATVNVAGSLFVDGLQNPSLYNPSQVRILAVDPSYADSTLIYSDNANLHLNSSDDVSIYSQGKEGYRLHYNDTLDILTTTLSSQRNGSLLYPNFDIRGTPVFRDNVYFDLNANVTILGNLSVFGDTSYFETTVTTTSALSVINRNANDTAFVVGQYTYPLSPNQTIARFEEGNTYGGLNPSVLNIKENQFVGIGVTRDTNYTTSLANFYVSGASIFRPHPGFPQPAGYPGFIVDMRAGSPTNNGNIEFYTGVGGQILLQSLGGGLVLDSGSSSNFVTVSGGLRVGEDVIAFALSDVKYKREVKKIDSALEKLDKINGVNFEWTDDAPFKGSDIGVLAHEIEEVIPEAVITRKNGAKAVRYEKIIPLLIEAIKELKSK